LDEFKKTFYVPRRVDVFAQKQTGLAHLELVETTDVRHCTPLGRSTAKSKSPRIAPEACSDFGAATG